AVCPPFVLHFRILRAVLYLSGENLLSTAHNSNRTEPSPGQDFIHC
ncbi:hypothetical protein MRX96_001037, partial [Rhipicephalus microplus]